jgi:cytochrome b
MGSRPTTSERPVWDLPLRVTHWALAISITVAYFTANILDSVHTMAGWLALGLIAFRTLWGFTGTRYSRFATSVRSPSAALRYLRRLLRGRPGRYLGLNPAGAAMLIAMLALAAVSALSGWMQVTVRFFGVWWVEAIHAWSSHLVAALALAHVVAVAAVSVLQGENLVRSMITGRKRSR